MVPFFFYFRLRPECVIFYTVEFSVDTLYLGNGRLIVNPDYQTTNMVYSLMCARGVYEAYDEIIISYGDIVYNKIVVEALLATDKDFAVVVDRNWLSYWQMRFSDPLSDVERWVCSSSGLIIDRSSLERRKRDRETIHSLPIQTVFGNQFDTDANQVRIW